MTFTSMPNLRLRFASLSLLSLLVCLAGCGDAAPAARASETAPVGMPDDSPSTSTTVAATAAASPGGVPRTQSESPEPLGGASPSEQQRASDLALKFLRETYGLKLSLEELTDMSGRARVVELAPDQEENFRRNLVALAPEITAATERVRELWTQWQQMTSDQSDTSTAAVVSRIRAEGAKPRTVVVPPKPRVRQPSDPALYNPFALSELPQAPVTRTETLPSDKAAALLQELLTLWRAINKEDLSTWPKTPQVELPVVLRRLDAGKLTVGDLLDAEEARRALPELSSFAQTRGMRVRRLQELIVLLGYGDTVPEGEPGAVPRPAYDEYKLPPDIQRLHDNQAAAERQRAELDARVQRIRDAVERQRMQGNR